MESYIKNTDKKSIGVHTNITQKIRIRDQPSQLVAVMQLEMEVLTVIMLHYKDRTLIYIKFKKFIRPHLSKIMN